MDSRAFPARDSDAGQDSSAHPLHFVIALFSLSIIVWMALSAIGILKSNPAALLGTWPTLLVFGGIAVYAAMHIAGATQVPPRHAYLAIGLLTYPITALFATFGQSLGFGAQELGGRLGASFLQVLQPMGSSVWPLLMAILGSAAIGILTAKLLREGTGAALKPAGAAGMRFDAGRGDAFEEDDPFAVPRSPTLRAPRRGLREPVPYPSANLRTDEPAPKAGMTATIEPTNKAIPEPLIRPSFEAETNKPSLKREEPELRVAKDPVFELPIFLQRDLGTREADIQDMGVPLPEESADLAPAAFTLRLRDLEAESAKASSDAGDLDAEGEEPSLAAAPRREVDVDWAALELLTQSEAEASEGGVREPALFDAFEVEALTTPEAISPAAVAEAALAEDAAEILGEGEAEDVEAREDLEALDASSVFAAALADQFYSAEGLLEEAEDEVLTAETSLEAVGAADAFGPTESADEPQAAMEESARLDAGPDEATPSPAAEAQDQIEAEDSADSPTEGTASLTAAPPPPEDAPFDPWSAFPSAPAADQQTAPSAEAYEGEEEEPEAQPSDRAAGAVDSPAAPNLPPEDAKGLFDGVAAEDDAQFIEAVRLVTESNRCSVAMLQRSLKVSFSEATALIERMYDEGLVGPQLPSGRRKILAKKKGASAE